MCRITNPFHVLACDVACLIFAPRCSLSRQVYLNFGLQYPPVVPQNVCAHTTRSRGLHRGDLLPRCPEILLLERNHQLWELSQPSLVHLSKNLDPDTTMGWSTHISTSSHHLYSEITKSFSGRVCAIAGWWPRGSHTRLERDQEHAPPASRIRPQVRCGCGMVRGAAPRCKSCGGECAVGVRHEEGRLATISFCKETGKAEKSKKDLSLSRRRCGIEGTTA